MKRHSRINKGEIPLEDMTHLRFSKKNYSSFQISQNKYNMCPYIEFMVEKE